ncbi:MAG: hypothetical protein ABIJ56_24325 [Pseudomonadota bacterium]
MRIIRYVGMVCMLILIIPAKRGLYAQEESTIEVIPDDSEKKAAQLEKRVKELDEKLAALEKKSKKGDLEKLLEKAEEEAGEEGEEEEKDAPVFHGGARALQAQNPEISLTGDFAGRLYINDDFRKPHDHHHHEGEEPEEDAHDHGPSALSGFQLRTLELNIQANLDPYSFAKAAFGIHGTELHICEAYVTWTGIAKRLSLTAGKFRQLFGVINRWHDHALDQADLPLSLQMFFGDHGLSQTGVSLRILLPKMWAHAEELTIDVTNAENDTLFAGEFWSVPTVLAHLKNYYDLSKSTYLEFGMSGLWGFNNKRSFMAENEDTGEEELTDEPWRNTVVAGADLTLSWVPPGRAKYLGFTWRTEAMVLWKETEEGSIHAFGGFTYVDMRVSRQFIVGARLDAGQKPELGDHREYIQASPYLTFWQSEFVYLRLQYNYLWQAGGADPQHLVMLQIDWSMGPHKHEKY